MSAEFVPSVSLALDDFVPVVVATAACLLLARQAAATRIHGVPWRAWVGAVSIGIGGLCKAVWKLIIALGGPDYTLLEKALFWFLMPGFVTLAFAMAQQWKRRELPHWIGGAPIGIGFTLGSILRADWPLLIVTIAAATAVGVLGILIARQRQDRTASSLFALQIVLAFALAPLAAPPQTSTKQWTEQTLNTIAQLALLVAAWRLDRRAQESTAPVVLVPQEALA